MISAQVSTQSAPDEHFWRRTKSRVHMDVSGALQAPLEQDMPTIVFSPPDTIADFSISDMSKLRDQRSTHDVRMVTPYTPYRTDDVPKTSLIGELEHLLSGMVFKQQFLDTNTIADMDNAGVINELREYGFVGIANRLTYLYNVTEEDEEDIKLDSLRGFATFVIKSRDMYPPQITVTDDGLIQAVWKHQQQGTLVMDFQESGDIAFTLLYGRWDQGTKRRKLIGELPPDQAMRHVGSFVYSVMRAW